MPSLGLKSNHTGFAIQVIKRSPRHLQTHINLVNVHQRFVKSFHACVQWVSGQVKASQTNGNDVHMEIPIIHTASRRCWDSFISFLLFVNGVFKQYGLTFRLIST